uniref:Tail spike protein n=1 Tax=Bacillus phage Adastra TaxID=3143958 RepID=A0AAU8BE05_9CAUD
MGRHIMQEDVNVVSVTSMGAKGDGVTDDTQAFIDALQYLKSIGGGILEVPAKETSYVMDGHAVLVDNVTIRSDGAVIEKTTSSTAYYTFISLGGTKKGYGAGASNVVFDGLTFKGSFSKGKSISITLHHSKDVVFRNCKFVETVFGGHTIDLGGCQNVTVDNCEFLGFKQEVGREYAEAIQIDHSTAEGNTGMDDLSGYDGLPSINVTVKNCKFLPITVGGVTYPAPNPLGSHSRVDGQYLRNIAFKNNVVQDGAPYPSDSGSSVYASGWLHFHCAEDIHIEDNEFINTTGSQSRAIGIWGASTGILMSDVGVVSPTYSNITPVITHDVSIKGNTFRGFKAEASGVGIVSVAGVDANSKQYFSSNISIEDNNFIDCFTASTTNDNTSSDCISLDKVKVSNISRNYASSVRRLVYATNSLMIKISHNQMTGAYFVPISANTSTDVEANFNQVDDSIGGFYFRAINGVNIVGNTIRNGKGTTGYAASVAFNGCSLIQSRGNILPGPVDTSTDTGISLYGSCSKGVIKDNLIYGYSSKSIHISADSTDITTS